MNDDDLARMGASHTIHRLRPRRPNHRLRNWLIIALIALVFGAMFGISYDADSARQGYGVRKTPKPTAVYVPPGRWETTLYCKNAGRGNFAKTAACRRPGGYR